MDSRRSIMYFLILVAFFLNACKMTTYHYAFISNRSGNLDLYVSTVPNQYVNITNDKDVDYGLKWSPDGKTILFAKQINKQYDLFLFHTESKTFTQLTNDDFDQYGPTFSPNGRSILFVSNKDDKQYEIYLMDLYSKQTKRITTNNRMDSSPTFHPDGKRIFYASFMDTDSSDKTTNSEIFVTDTLGSHHVRITYRPGNDGAIDISPDGKKIACAYFLNGKSDIYTMNLDGSIIKQITSDSLDNRWPRWTPNGKHIAYTRVADNSDIWIMTKNGKKKKEFVSSAKRDEILEFKPVIKKAK